MEFKQPFVAFQADPLKTLNHKSDTTLLIAQEAQKREYTLFHYCPSFLRCTQDDVRALGVFFTLDDARQVQTQSEVVDISLNDAAHVFIRQNPPYDFSYITALDILLHVKDQKNIYNSPRALLLYKEKLIPFYFPHLMPKTLITATKQDILNLLDTCSHIVLKPLHSFGGADVFLIDKTDLNTIALIDLLLNKYPYGLIAQEYLRQVSHNERRLIFIKGQLKAVFKRIPPQGSIRTNTCVGGVPTPCEVSQYDHALTKQLQSFFVEEKILLAGVDAIDDKLIEVNITSPTGLVYANNLYGYALENDIWNMIHDTNT